MITTETFFKSALIDVDNTLIPRESDADIYRGTSPENQRLINEWQDLGNHAGLATGRPVWEIYHLDRDIPLSGPSIVFDGAQVLDLKRKELYFEWALEPEDAYNLTQKFAQLKVRTYVTDPKKSPKACVEYHRPSDVGSPLNVFTYFMSQQAYDKSQTFLSDYSHLSRHIFYRPERTYPWAMMFSHKMANKGSGAHAVAQLLNITSDEIVAFGDGPNDIPLFEAVGYTIAPKNADEAIRHRANLVVPSVKDNAVAHGLNHVILSFGREVQLFPTRGAQNALYTEPHRLPAPQSRPFHR